MKKTKRLLCLILSVFMLASALPTVFTTVLAAPSSGAVMFVSDGGTSGGGGSADNPCSLASAIQNLGTSGGTVVICGKTTLTGNTVLGTGFNSTIKITSVYDGVDYREKADACIYFSKDWINVSSKHNFEYENVDFVMNGANCSFYANGYSIVMGKGVNVKTSDGIDDKNAANFPNVYGGSAYDLGATTNFPANTSVTVLSGTFRDVRAGGKGSADKPRHSLSGTLAICPDAVIKGEATFDFGENGKIEGEKVLITIGGTNSSFKSESEALRKITVDGNGYVTGGVKPGVYNICANSGYGAKIGNDIIANGEYQSEEKSFSVSFVESDVNAAAELEASRPSLPAAFPGEYIKGYDNGDGSMSFKPSGNITIAESATILVRLMTTEEKIAGKYDTEKAKKGVDWFYDNIAYLDTYGAFDTFDNFDANREITRAEFVELIGNFKKFNASVNEIEFNDVAKDHKYYDSVRNATMAKIVNGYDNGDGTFSFKPDASITRAEVVTVINRAFDVAELAPLKYKNKIPNFSDVEENHWAAYQIIAAAGGTEKQQENEKSDITGTGDVEYTVDGTVVYIKGNAAEDGDGSSEEKAISYSNGIAMLKGGGTAVICGPVEFNSNFFFTNENTAPVIFTSVYGGVDYRETADAAIIYGSNWRNGVPGGEVIFDNISFISRGTNNAVYCDNHKVTFGKDVVCVVESGSPINIYAGSAFDLGACRNYVGSENTSAANTGNYFGNLTINGGTWGNITGGGKGTAEKPRESNGSAVAVSGTAVIGSLSGGSTEGAAKVNGLRTIVLNNTTNVTLEQKEYDIMVYVNGEASAEIVSVAADSVTLKVTANNGGNVSGVAEDGTITLKSEGALVVTSNESGAVSAVWGTKDSISSIGSENVEAVTDEYLAELDATQEKRIAEIKATKTEIKPTDGCTAYYVANGGNDSNDGKTPATAWATIEKVNVASLIPGDVVYFKRGDEWRNVSLTAKPGISYSAYGEGEKPILNRSPFDGAKHGSWKLVDGYTNVYVYSEKFANDIGTIAFNERTFTDIYAQKICFKYKNGQPYSGNVLVEAPLNELKNDLDFWHDLKGPNVTYAAGGELYLRSDSGNPAERFSNIEFNQRGNAVSIGGNNVTIDNLCIRHSGSHGVGSGTVNNLKVTNCVFEWIGGSMQNYNDGFVRFGNAVEVYGGCDGYTVDNCYIDQVYDAGVTHQVSHASPGDYIMKNVTYSNNVILNCIYSIEHFNRVSEGTTRYLLNILYENNLCRFAGYGFGNTRPNKGAASHIRSGTITDTANFVIRNNVFDRSLNVLFLLTSGGDEEIQWKNNVYIHRLGASYGTIKSVSVTYGAQIAKEVESKFKHPEENGKYLFVVE